MCFVEGGTTILCEGLFSEASRRTGAMVSRSCMPERFFPPTWAPTTRSQRMGRCSTTVPCPHRSQRCCRSVFGPTVAVSVRPLASSTVIGSLATSSWATADGVHDEPDEPICVITSNTPHKVAIVRSVLIGLPLVVRHRPPGGQSGATRFRSTSAECIPVRRQTACPAWEKTGSKGNSLQDTKLRNVGRSFDMARCRTTESPFRIMLPAGNTVQQALQQEIRGVAPVAEIPGDSGGAG